jgi:hypothetical protein
MVYYNLVYGFIFPVFSHCSFSPKNFVSNLRRGYDRVPEGFLTPGGRKNEMLDSIRAAIVANPPLLAQFKGLKSPQNRAVR